VRVSGVVDDLREFLKDGVKVFDPPMIAFACSVDRIEYMVVLEDDDRAFRVIFGGGFKFPAEPFKLPGVVPNAACAAVGRDSDEVESVHDRVRVGCA